MKEQTESPNGIDSKIEMRSDNLAASLDDMLLNFFLLGMTVLLAALALVSLSWRMQIDAPIFHYIAMLMDSFDYMPYRDIYNYALPGTYFLHWLIIKCVGYSDFAFRIFDLTWLAALMVVTYRFMKDFSPRVGYAAAILTGLLYLSKGAGWSFERDFVLLLPLALAILAYRSTWFKGEIQRNILIGFWVGAASVMKPHAVLALLAFIPSYGGEEKGSLPKKIGGLVLGCSILPILCFFWIWSNGALPSFWKIFTNYVPLYNELNRNYEILTGIRWFDDVIFSLNNLYPVGILLAPAAIGAYVFLERGEHHQKLVYLFLSLFFVFVFYLILPNKLFLYHWLPLEYFVVLLVSLCFHSVIKQKRFVYLLTAFVLALNLFYNASTYILIPPEETLLEEVDIIGEYLNKRRKPGEKVQSVGWIGSVIHGLYKGKAPLATPYPFITAFIHHPDHPYIQRSKTDFLTRLRKAPPRFIVYGLMEFLPEGVDIKQRFPALENFINRSYSEVLRGQTFIIYELRISR